MDPKSTKRQRKDEGENCSSQPTKRKQQKHVYIYGNYHSYYGYRIGQALDEDPRMKVLKREWFEGRDCLDIGCNQGFITISIAQKFACRSILGIDIDDRLIGRARQNLKAMAGVEEDGETIKQSAEERDRVNKPDDAGRMEQSNEDEDRPNQFKGTGREEQSSTDATNELGGADSGFSRGEASQLLRGSGSDNCETIKQSAEERDRVNKPDDANRMEQFNEDDRTNDGGADGVFSGGEASQLLRVSGSDNCETIKRSAEERDRVNKPDDANRMEQSNEGDRTNDGGADSVFSRGETSQLLRVSDSDNLVEDKERPNELEGMDMKLQSFEDKDVTMVTKELKCTYRRFFRHGARQMSKDSGSDNVEGKFKDPDLLERVHFKTENFIQKFPSVLDATYDTVLCLSVTKWVQLNWGDEGLICLFAKIWQVMRPGGILLLEPQPWKSYERKRLVSEVAVANFRDIVFKPDAFRDILLDKIGFRSMEMISTHVPNSTAGFNRPIYLLRK